MTKSFHDFLANFFLRMGKLNIFEITLSNFQGVFYAGQNVQGHCTVELNEKMSMRGEVFCLGYFCLV